MSDMKTCKKCRIAKDPEKYFYRSSGCFRGECKRCTIKRNVAYQKLMQTWKLRYVNNDARREYMRSYYAKNPYKFLKYREKFKMKHPGYYKKYYHAYGKSEK